MAYEQKNNSGSLFKNTRKEKPTHPDYRGSAKIEGVDYWMSAWIKNADDPDKQTFMSFSFEAKEQQGERRQERYDTGHRHEDRDELDSEIPF